MLDQRKQEEASRLEKLEQDHLAGDIEAEADETTPWLNAAYWPEQFAQRPIEIIARSALQPVSVVVAAALAVAVDHVLGS